MSGMLFQQDGPRVLHLGFDVSKVVATGDGKLSGGGVSNPESATPFVFDDSPFELLAFAAS